MCGRMVKEERGGGRLWRDCDREQNRVIFHESPATSSYFYMTTSFQPTLSLNDKTQTNMHPTRMH